MPVKIASAISFCFLSLGCSRNDTIRLATTSRDPPVQLNSPHEMEANLGARCWVEGTPVKEPKGFMTLTSKDGAVWYVSLRGAVSWPDEVIGKTLRVTGTVFKHEQKVNSRGEPVNDEGQIVQGYGGGKPIFLLGDSLYEVISAVED
jgi:hypothetical protein